MATVDQREALLAITCPWCHAAPGEFCSAPNGQNKRDTEDGVRRATRLPISTLDGGCHDARWQRALGQSAPVLGAVVEGLHGARVHKRARTAAPVTAGRMVTAGGERPW